MTLEQTLRSILEGFIKDPPDTDFQEGFMDAVIVIASEVVGMELPDNLPSRAPAEKTKFVLTLLRGGKDSSDTVRR